MLLTIVRVSLCLCAGTVFYGIYYASFYTQYTQLLAAYALTAPTSEEVLSSSPADFEGALAGSGSLAVPQANTMVSGLVQPPCYGALCQPSLYALPPDTPYQASDCFCFTHSHISADQPLPLMPVLFDPHRHVNLATSDALTLCLRNTDRYVCA